MTVAAVMAVLGGMFAARPAQADTITVDEFGVGIGVSPGFIGPDPGPGGLGATLTYILPFLRVPGDVLLFDPIPGFVLDVLRFNAIGGVGTLHFYSDNLDGFDAPADTPSPPLAFYANIAFAFEVGNEDFGSASYTPLPGQPGFNPAAPGGSYVFISDGHTSVPEPSTMLLLGSGLVGLGLYRRKRLWKKKE